LKVTFLKQLYEPDEYVKVLGDIIAAMSGKLVLSDFTVNAINKFKKN